MAAKKKFYIRVPNALVEVSEELYSEYHSIERHLGTLDEKDERHGMVSFNALDNGELVGEDLISDPLAEGVEEDVIAQLMAIKLRGCIQRLPLTEQSLIYAIYYEGLSERKLAEQMAVHYMTIHNRKSKILRKLKKMMEN